MLNIRALMNAMEIYRFGSVKKAADKLYIGQPNLSRQLIDLEDELGVTLFERSSKGMTATPEGEIIFEYADKLFRQAEMIEDYCKAVSKKVRSFSLATLSADYITEAFSSFSERVGSETSIELYFNEANTEQIINSILCNQYRLGIIRYDKAYDSYFRKFFEEKNISFELLNDPPCVIAVSNKDVLSVPERVSVQQLGMYSYTEVKYNDPFVPFASDTQVRTETPESKERVIYVSSRISQIELVARNTRAYMITAPLTDKQLEKYGLIQLEISDSEREYRDVFIHSSSYALTKTDNMFLDELMRSKRKYRQGVLL